MRLDVKIDTSALRAKTEREIKNLGYSTAQAINKVAQEIQNEERVNLDRKFKLRRAGFMYRLIKIVTFASANQGRPYAEIAIDASKARVLLSSFEEGGDKTSSVGQNVAVPITGEAARPTFSDPVPQAFTFKGLSFQKVITKEGKVEWHGKNRTFIIPGVGVFQRVSTTVTKLIYSFKKRVHLDSRLDFVAIAKRVWEERFEKVFREIYERRPK